MRRITYLACTLLVSIVVAAMIGWSLAAGNFVVPAVAIPMGAIVVVACRRNVGEVLADERLDRVRSHAALRTLEVAVIAGAVIAVILCSFMVSDALSPKITGRVFTSGNGTSSMVINLYKPQSPETPENLIRTVTIRDINAMNEVEAMEYSRFRQEAFHANEQNGIIGMTLGAGIAALLVIFGAFYRYYDRKY